MKRLDIFTTPPDAAVVLHHDNGTDFVSVPDTFIRPDGHRFDLPDDLPMPYGAVLDITWPQGKVRTIHPRGVLMPQPGNKVLFMSDDFRQEWYQPNPNEGGAPFPDEQGALTRDGYVFVNQGKAWRSQGASMFNLPARFNKGQDISPQWNWMQRRGANKCRVFPNWTSEGDGGVHANDRFFDDPAAHSILVAFLAEAAQYGRRVQFSVVTENRVPLEYWRKALQVTFDACSATWNGMVEVENEPWVRDTDVAAVMASVERHGVMFATGILAKAAPVDGYVPMDAGTYGDYGTHRTSRDDHYPQNGKDLQDLRTQAAIRPWDDDEPAGIMDVPNHSGRVNDPQYVGSHYAVAAMFGGATIHTQAGINGLTPEQTNEPLTMSICQSITEVWKFIPAEAQRGNYVNTGRDGGTGIVYRPWDSQVNRAYGSRLGNTMWVVVPVPRKGWEPEVQPGWKIAEMGPVPGVLRLETT